MLVSLAVAAIVGDHGPSVIPPPAFVIRVVRDGEQVRDDGCWKRRWPARHGDEDWQMLAFCVNAVDWMIDRTLDLPVIVGD